MGVPTPGSTHNIVFDNQQSCNFNKLFPSGLCCTLVGLVIEKKCMHWHVNDIINKVKLEVGEENNLQYSLMLDRHHN